MAKKKCTYCGKPTKNVRKLGREYRFIEIPCCESCLEQVDELLQTRKDEMVEVACVISSLRHKNQTQGNQNY